MAFYGQDKYFYYIHTHSLEPEPILWPGLERLQGCAEQTTKKCSFGGGFICKQFGFED